jgi:hypothetical protein
MNLPKMGILYRAEYNGPKISQLVASDYAVWALQEDGCLISRIGMNVRCPMGHAWKANEYIFQKNVVQ